MEKGSRTIPPPDGGFRSNIPDTQFRKLPRPQFIVVDALQVGAVHDLVSDSVVCRRAVQSRTT